MAFCCTLPPCPVASASATSVPVLSISPTSFKPPDRSYGKSCPSIPRDTAILHINVFPRSPVIPCSSVSSLRDQGLLRESDLTRAPQFPEDSVDYGPVIEFKMDNLRRAAHAFLADASPSDRDAFGQFCESASPWLDDYAVFMACKDAHRGTMWTLWEPEIRRRDPHAIEALSKKLAPELHAYKYWQFEFFKQWESSQSRLPATRHPLDG